MDFMIALFLGSAAGVLLVAIVTSWVVKLFAPNMQFWNRMMYAAPIAALIACFISYFTTMDGLPPGSERHLAQWAPMVLCYVLAGLVWWFIAIFVATPSSGKKIIHTSDTDD